MIDLTPAHLGGALRAVRDFYKHKDTDGLMHEEEAHNLPGKQLIGPPIRRAMTALERAAEHYREGRPLDAYSEVCEAIHNLEVVPDRVVNRMTNLLTVGSKALGLARQCRTIVQTMNPALYAEGV